MQSFSLGEGARDPFFGSQALTPDVSLHPSREKLQAELSPPCLRSSAQRPFARLNFVLHSSDYSTGVLAASGAVAQMGCRAPKLCMALIDIPRILRQVRAGDLCEAIDLARASGFFPIRRGHCRSQSQITDARSSADRPHLPPRLRITDLSAFPATRGLYKIIAIETSPEHY
jgi:hypothetical protein